MWAEIDVSFDSAINTVTPSALEEFFAPSDDVQTCFSRTTLAPLQTLPNSLTFGKMKQSCTLLLFKEDKRSTKIFVESTHDNVNVHDIKREVENLVASIRSVSKSKKIKLKSISARIGLEGKSIFTGQRSKYKDRFLENVKSNVPTKIYILESTLCAIWILTTFKPNLVSNVGIETYLLSFVSSVVLTVLWIFLGSFSLSSSIKFSEI